MNQELLNKIAEKDEWTFKECLGLGAEYGLKPRFVIALVLAQGKNYADGDVKAAQGKRK